MSRNLTWRFWELAGRLLDDGDAEIPSEWHEEGREELANIVDAAKEEWQAAQNYFNQASDPELVDHAILCVQAAERKYMYWLKQLKRVQ